MNVKTNWQGAFEALVDSKKEPEFFTKKRREAFEIYKNLPWPDSSMEEWRRTKIDHLGLEKYSFLKGEVALRKAQFLPAVSGTLSFGAYQCHQSHLKKNLAEKGVVFCSLQEALVNHPEVVQKYMNRGFSPKAGKFQALNQAFCTHGAVLYIPKNITVQEPFQIFFEEGEEKYASMPYLLVVVEEGAKGSLFFESQNQGQEGEVFRNGALEVFVGDNGSLELGEIQSLNQKSLYFWNGVAHLGRHSRIQSLFANFGSSLLKSKWEVHLQQPGGDAYLGGVYFADQKQHFDQRTLQHHISSHSTSNLLYRGAVKGRGYTIYQGLIQVEKEGQKTNAYQTNNNLLLSDKARADSIPGLEINANDLKCSHGATVGKINPQQVYYLTTRGLSEQEAKNLIVLGFFEQVMQKISGSLRKKVLQGVASKLGIAYEEDKLEDV